MVSRAIKGFLENGTYWVRDEHSDEEAKAVSQLEKLFNALNIQPLMNLNDLIMNRNDLKKSQVNKAYFNILYRCDFEIKIDEDNNIEPQAISGCDIAIPGKISQISEWSGMELKQDSVILLGLDPFCATENNKYTEMKWDNNHFTGKVMFSYLSGRNMPLQSSITLPENTKDYKDCKKLYAGLLHKEGGKAFTPEDLSDWLTCRTQNDKIPYPNSTYVLFAQTTTEPQWMGIYLYTDKKAEPPKDKNKPSIWTPITDLVNQEDFWRAMLATGAARDEEPENLGDFFPEEDT